MARAVSGDRSAIEALLRLHHDRLATLCRRLCGNDADGADATQEALIAVVKGLPRFDGRSAFATWAYRVATNACLDELRRRGRQPLLLGDDEPEVAVRSTGSSGHEDDPAEAVATRLDIDAALAQIHPAFRAAVVLRDVAGLDYQQIAETLGIAPGTVRSRISRGRQALAILLEGNRTGPSERPTTDHG